MGVFSDHFLAQYIKRPNRIRTFQDFFQKGNKPVFLKTRSDVTIYKTLMGATVFGLAYSFYYLGKMASGKMKKT